MNKETISILQINSVANSGSTGRITEEIGKLVKEKGWKSYIAYGRWHTNSDSILIRIGNKLDIWMHGLLSRFFDRHGFGSRMATRRLIWKIKQIKPDIIHLHNIHGYYLNVELFFDFLKGANIPVIWTLHDCWSFTGHCVHYQKQKCYKWKTGCYQCENLKDYPSSLFIDNSVRNYRDKKRLFTSVQNLMLIPVCSWLEHEIGHSFLSCLNRKVIINGVDVEKFNISDEITTLRRRHNINDEFIILAVASNWNPTKGEDDIYKLSRKLDENFRIVMIGLSPEQIKKLPHNIIGLERTENIEQLSQYYSMANVLLNPTYQDTFPTVNLEAMACGTPVITYDTGGSADAVTSDTGFVVNHGDIDGILSSLRDIMRIDRNIYRMKCFERVLTYFDKDKRYADYIHLYEDILKSGNECPFK